MSFSRTLFLSKRLLHDSRIPILSTVRIITTNEGSRKRSSSYRNLFATCICTSVIVGCELTRRKVWALEKDSHVVENAGKEKKGLPYYSAHEVSKHSSPTTKVWVTYGSGVYDVTEFVKEHPGGDKIMMAAGGQLEPFWDLFAIHKRADVFEILEKYRIGNLNLADRETGKSSNDHWSNEPRRHPVLVARSSQPYNAEPPPELLVENFYTPNAIFFTRNHLPVPDVNEKDYRLSISGIGINKSVELTLEDLKTKFPITTISVTLQCAGNRRSEMNKVKEVKGLSWGKAAISNARWTGVKLVDLLQVIGADIENKLIRHVQFEGLDLDPSSSPYGASIPSSRALDPNSDVLIAFEMNGEPLPRDHGFPVRIVAPGITGARNVKWLGSIILSDVESDSLWQKRDYKGFPPYINAQNVDFSKAPAIQDYPIQSAICLPTDGSSVIVKGEDDVLKIKGYAYSGGGRKITRVDVSIDGGKTWLPTHLKHDPNAVPQDFESSTTLYKTWSWTIWESEVPLNGLKPGSKLELVCKATDSGYSVQPEHFDGIWNFRGVLANAWNRVCVTLDSGS